MTASGPIDSPSFLLVRSRSLSLSLSICVCSLLLSTKIGDTILYILRTGEIDINTRDSLACELSCIAYKHIEICFFLLSSSSHSHLCSLSSCVLMCGGGGVCILIYENRSTASRRCPGPPFLLFFSPHSLFSCSLLARFVLLIYLSVGSRAHSDFSFPSGDTPLYQKHSMCMCAYRFFSSHSCTPPWSNKRRRKNEQTNEQTTAPREKRTRTREGRS